jgi:hypothetical protein
MPLPKPSRGSKRSRIDNQSHESCPDDSGNFSLNAEQYERLQCYIKSQVKTEVVDVFQSQFWKMINGDMCEHNDPSSVCEHDDPSSVSVGGRDRAYWHKLCPHLNASAFPAGTVVGLYPTGVGHPSLESRFISVIAYVPDNVDDRPGPDYVLVAWIGLAPLLISREDEDKLLENKSINREIFWSEKKKVFVQWDDQERDEANDIPIGFSNLQRTEVNLIENVVLDSVKQGAKNPLSRPSLTNASEESPCELFRISFSFQGITSAIAVEINYRQELEALRRAVLKFQEWKKEIEQKLEEASKVTSGPTIVIHNHIYNGPPPSQGVVEALEIQLQNASIEKKINWTPQVIKFLAFKGSGDEQVPSNRLVFNTHSIWSDRQIVALAIMGPARVGKVRKSILTL